ncbi:hypothetical protein OG21DRAFT_1481555 [Imleria badia]|nr:hypothetical protein OG21DRAFT_1481555 [Imleria badia]
MSPALRDGAIRTCSLVDANSFIEELFPDTLILEPELNQPKTVAHFWDSFRAKHRVAWDKFLGHLNQPNNEREIELFLNTLISHNKVEKRPGRLWSAANKDKPAGGDANRKPDLICFDPIKGNRSDWGHFMSAGELKSGDFEDVYELLVERAALLFRNQDSRRFVLTFALVKQSMTVALFDRGGSIVCKAFDIGQQKLLFLRFILGLTFAPLTSLGYDSTVTTRLTLSHAQLAIYSEYPSPLRALKELAAIDVPNFIREHFSKHWSIDPAIIVKDIWTDENTSLTEGMILALLKMKGVQGVPRILAEERVLSEPADDEIAIDPLSEEVKPHSMPTSARPDSTTLIRSRLNQSGFQLGPKALKAAQRTSHPSAVGGFEPRAHIRSYVTPWAVPIFQFRSGVELLGIVADVLTAHEQAASKCYVTKPDTFPFRFLHRDPSILNLGMVPSEGSDFPACPHRSNGEHRGLLYDWGFAKVAEVSDYKDSPVDLTVPEIDEDDEDEAYTIEDMHASSDTESAPRSTIYVPIEDRTDSGLYTATPDIIGDFETLVKLVRHCIREEQPALEITGTRPFMAVELLVASLVHTDKKHPWRESYQDIKHEIRHDLEAFYMVLVSLCLLYERPHARKGLNDYATPGAPLLPEEDVLPFCAVLWLMGQEELIMSNIRLRYLALCTSRGFTTMVEPYLSDYFAPIAPYLQRIRALLYGLSDWGRGSYKSPNTFPTYDAFRTILFDAMKTVPSNMNKFAEIIEPPKMLYCPISPEGQWEGKSSWSWDKPFPMRSNNAFGFVEDQLSSPFTTPSASASTTEGYVKVLDGSAILSAPSMSRAKATPLAGHTALKTKGLRVSARYAILPEVERGLSQRITHIKGSSNRQVIDKPYLVYSPSKLFRRRQKWLTPTQGRGKV